MATVTPSKVLHLTVGSANVIRIPLVDEAGNAEDLTNADTGAGNGALRIVEEVESATYILYAADLTIGSDGVVTYQMSQAQADALVAGSYWLFLMLRFDSDTYQLELREPIRVEIAAAASQTAP